MKRLCLSGPCYLSLPMIYVNWHEWSWLSTFSYLLLHSTIFAFFCSISSMWYKFCYSFEQICTLCAIFLWKETVMTLHIFLSSAVITNISSLWSFIIFVTCTFNYFSEFCNIRFFFLCSMPYRMRMIMTLHTFLYSVALINIDSLLYFSSSCSFSLFWSNVRSVFPYVIFYQDKSVQDSPRFSSVCYSR